MLPYILVFNILPYCLYFTTDFLMMDIRGPKYVEVFLKINYDKNAFGLL